VRRKTDLDRSKLGSVCQVYDHHVEGYRARLAKSIAYCSRLDTQDFLSDRLLECEMSGKETTLPPSPPLRTVREPFDSYRSSLTNAPCGTRFLNVQVLAVDFTVAVRVQEHAVVHSVWAAFRPPDDVMIVPSRLPGDLLATNWAQALLCYPYVQELSVSCYVLGHLCSQPLFKVDFPFGIVRVSCNRSDRVWFMAVNRKCG
jgi:hypothetical protein